MTEARDKTDARDERRPAGELEAAVMAALWAAGAPSRPDGCRPNSAPAWPGPRWRPY